jgi:hypothetical protein
MCPPEEEEQEEDDGESENDGDEGIFGRQVVLDLQQELNLPDEDNQDAEEEPVCTFFSTGRGFELQPYAIVRFLCETHSFFTYFTIIIQMYRDVFFRFGQCILLR